jgi:hypothetical protein
MKWLWNFDHYWAIWFWGLLGTFALREFWAVGSGRPQETFSYWVWDHLKIRVHEGISQWNAADYLTFGIYIVTFSWLAFHFWWRKFA